MSAVSEEKEGFYLSEEGEWVPDGWIQRPLEKIGLLTTGKTPAKANPHHWGKVTAFITPTDFSGERSLRTPARRLSLAGEEAFKNQVVPPESVAVSCIGSDMGKVVLLREQSLTNQQINTLTADSENHPLFWYYAITADYPRLRSIAEGGGSTMPLLNKGDFSRLVYSHPKIDEQKSIAAVLGSLDDKIELLREQNETLEALAQTLFKRWFIDFNFPDENGKPYKDSGGNPDNLDEVTLDEFIHFNPAEKINRNEEHLFFDMKCLAQNQLSLAEGIYKKASSATAFREGDTLLAKITPCLENGKTGFVQDLKGEKIARGSTEFIVMRAKDNGSPYFNYCLARNPIFRNYVIRSMTGSSGRQRVPIDRVKSYSVLNRADLIRKFDNLVAPNFKKIKTNTQQIHTLTKLRDTLLPKLMKGEIRI